MDAITTSTNNGAELERLLTCEPLRAAFDRIIVVDNQSTDASEDVAREHGAVVVTTRKRLGYGACINLGALRARGHMFAVLNPDIEFDSAEVVMDLERHLLDPTVGLVAPALLLPDGRVQDSARHMPTAIDLLVRRRFNRTRGAIYASGDVPWVVGACFLARRDAWEAVGGVDERFFLYFDDVDLCWRMWQAGFKIRLDANIIVRHEHGKASRRSLLGWATRRHMASATRFYWTNPRFAFTRTMPSEVVFGVGEPGHATALADMLEPVAEPMPALAAVGEEL
jgi:GT2 family glycosyltransferase